MGAPSYMTEFPDYPVGEMPALPAGFVDRSWRVEPCPCFIHEEIGLVLWTDRADPDLRDGRRFTLQKATNRHPEAGWQFDDGLLFVVALNDWAEMARVIAPLIETKG